MYNDSAMDTPTSSNSELLGSQPAVQPDQTDQVSTDTDLIPDNQDSDSPSFKRFILDALETIAIALVIFFVIYTFIAQPHLVKGESMKPNYFEGEYILTSKIYNWLGEPQRGDVIVLKSPDEANVQFIKRIIGMPGEKIMVEDNKVHIINSNHPNGFILEESYLADDLSIPDGAFLKEGQWADIPDGNFAVMGDNRPASYDSRNWGLLPKDNIIGKAFFVYWPLPSFGFVAHATYND